MRGAAVVVAVVVLGAVALGAQGKSPAPGAPPESTETGEPAKDAGAGKAGTGSLSFRLGYYDNGDSGDGNPFLDEALTVIEPVVMFTYNVTDRTGIWAKMSYDRVTSASIDRLSKFPMQSGASGDNYFGLDAGMRYAFTDDVRAGFFGSFSTEYDYRSIGLGGDIEIDLANKNATLKGSLNAFFDDIDIIRFNGAENEGSDNRTSFAGTLTWYQRMAPRWHGEFGLTLGHQSGFLETAYNAVVIENPALPPNPNLENMARGIEITEELPSSRSRGALFARVRHFFGTDSAVELGGRIYSDSWGITSFAIEPRYYTWIARDSLRMRLRYRYYTQSEADDYQDRFFNVTNERTQDSDLADFDSHLGGIQFVWHASKNQTFDISFDYVKRSDGIDQMLGSIGWGIKF